MLPSYEAIYDHGQLTWISGTPGPVRTRVIVTPIPEHSIGESREIDLQQAILHSFLRKRPSEAEIEYVMQKVRGAWGKKTLDEVDALIKQRRIEDWGEDENVQ